MSIYKGNTIIKNIYKGSTPITKVYKGSTLVFGGGTPQRASYLIDNYGVRHEFSLADTPITNFASSGDGTTTIKVNGTAITKNNIIELYFGDDYNEVTTITKVFWIYNFDGMTTLDLSGLSGLQSITGQFSLYNMGALTSINLDLPSITSLPNYCLGAAIIEELDLSKMPNLASVGNNFINNCNGLTKLNLTNLGNLTSIGTSFIYMSPLLTEIQIDNDWSNIIYGLTNSFRSVPNVSTSTLYANIQSNADAFKLKVNGVIDNWGVVITEIHDSYITLNDDSVIQFTAANTPIENFCNSSGVITIEGVQYTKTNIVGIVFGDDYLNVTSIPGKGFFCFMFPYMTSIDLWGLQNITSTAQYFVGNNTSLQSIDLSILNKLTTIQQQFLYNCRITHFSTIGMENVTIIDNDFLTNNIALQSIDLTGFTSLVSLDSNFLNSVPSLTEIYIGGKDWSTIDNYGGLNNAQNVSTSTLYANTQELADTFKSEMNGVIDNWGVVLSQDTSR